MERVRLLPCAAAGTPAARSARANVIAPAPATSHRARFGLLLCVIAILHAPGHRRVWGNNRPGREAETLPQPARARGPRVESESMRGVPCPEGPRRIIGHRRRRRDLRQGPAVRPPEREPAVGLWLDVIALLVDRAVVATTEQREVR